MLNIYISSGKTYSAHTKVDAHGELFIYFTEVEYVGSEWVPVTNGQLLYTAVHGVNYRDGVVTITDGELNTYQLSETNCIEFNDTVSNASDIYDAINDAFSALGGNAPVFTVPPSITGNKYVGQVLSTTNGDWVGTAPITFTYEWKRVGQDVAIGTESTYTITSLDADEYITCTVTATNDFGSGSSVSNQVLVSITWGVGCAKNWGDSTNAVWGV